MKQTNVVKEDVTPGACRTHWGNENAHNILFGKKECKIVSRCERKH